MPQRRGKSAVNMWNMPNREWLLAPEQNSFVFYLDSKIYCLEKWFNLIISPSQPWQPFPFWFTMFLSFYSWLLLIHFLLHLSTSFSACQGPPKDAYWTFWLNSRNNDCISPHLLPPARFRAFVCLPRTTGHPSVSHFCLLHQGLKWAWIHFQ